MNVVRLQMRTRAFSRESGSLASCGSTCAIAPVSRNGASDKYLLFEPASDSGGSGRVRKLRDVGRSHLETPSRDSVSYR